MLIRKSEREYLGAIALGLLICVVIPVTFHSSPACYPGRDNVAVNAFEPSNGKLTTAHGEQASTAKAEKVSTRRDKSVESPWYCDMRLGDMALAFLTYCLVIVGWAGIKSSERTVRAIERPWLFIQKSNTSALLFPVAGTPPRFHVFLHNAGRSPARITSFRGNLAITRLDIDPERIPLNSAPMDAAYGVIIPAANEEKEAAIALQPISADMASQVLSGDLFLFMRGVLSYAGPFGGDNFETAFCLRWNEAAQTFEGYGGERYNYST